MAHQLTHRPGTPTMRGEYCLATSEGGQSCIFGQGHAVTYHMALGGESWVGDLPASVPVSVTVGNLPAVEIGTVTVSPGERATDDVADLLEAAAREMRSWAAALRRRTQGGGDR